jgi:hypothetical protein
VCSGKKWQNTLENGWDDEDFDDEPWFWLVYLLPYVYPIVQ